MRTMFSELPKSSMLPQFPVGVKQKSVKLIVERTSAPIAGAFLLIFARTGSRSAPSIMMVPGGRCLRLSIIIVLVSLDDQSQTHAQKDHDHKGHESKDGLEAHEFFILWEMRMVVFVSELSQDKPDADDDQADDHQADVGWLFKPGLVAGL